MLVVGIAVVVVVGVVVVVVVVVGALLVQRRHSSNFDRHLEQIVLERFLQWVPRRVAGWAFRRKPQ
jgi:hypothetical protein